MDVDLERVAEAFAASLRLMTDAGFLSTDEAEPPVAGARWGRDDDGIQGWYLPDPDRPGKWLHVMPDSEAGR